MYTILIAIIFIIVGVFCVKNVLSSDQKGRSIPGPRGLPIVGSVLQIKPEKIYEQFSEFAKQYGKIFKLQIFDTNVVVLNSVEMVNKAFVTEGHIFNERQYLFIADKIGLMKSVSFIYFNKEHNIARKAFVKSLHMYGTGIAKFENIVQGELERLIQEIDSYKGENFEVVWLIKRSIVNIISILLIGEKATDEHVKLFFELTSGEDFFLNAATNTILSNFPFLLHLPYYKRRMDKIIEAKKILQKKYVLDVKNGSVDKDKTGFVSGLFHCQQQGSGPESELTDDMIKAISITDVMTAGVLTTSATLLNAILCLVNHPEYQARIQEEVDAVFGPDNKPSVNQRHECSFIEAVILETMRFIPTTPFLLPHACKVNTELEGFAIKSHSQVLANLWYIHHDESIWGDPWTYRPERFLGDDGHILPNDHVYMKRHFLLRGSKGVTLQYWDNRLSSSSTLMDVFTRTHTRRETVRNSKLPDCYPLEKTQCAKNRNEKPGSAKNNTDKPNNSKNRKKLSGKNKKSGSSSSQNQPSHVGAEFETNERPYNTRQHDNQSGAGRPQHERRAPQDGDPAAGNPGANRSSAQPSQAETSMQTGLLLDQNNGGTEPRQSKNANQK